MIHTLDLGFMGLDQTIASFLIESEAGPILVETGPHSTFPKLEEEIKACGYQVSDIRHVLLTHIHLDHAGAAWAFAEKGATIYLHPFGARHLKDPSKLMESARRIYQDQMDSLWGQMKPIPADQLKEVEDRAVIEIGAHQFKALHTPGHAVHHIAWQLDDQIFTGDVAGIRISTDGMIVPPCPPPDINIEDWINSLNILRAVSPATIYLTHFGKVTDVVEHLAALEKRLLDWSGWMKPQYEAGRAVKEVIPEFEAYVKKQLINHGMDEQKLRQYESANPSWMSVAGLMRYWKKRSS